MKLKYYSLGTIIKYDNVKLMVIRQKHNNPVCAGCYFSTDMYRKFNGGKRISCITHRLACTKHYRYDHNHVIFRLLSE